ncbi:MAG TPA: methyltransferase [Gemmatimonadaceae bacterium]|jgi:protein-S-isoprenylcysteine O-methyltransferase Ste14
MKIPIWLRALSFFLIAPGSIVFLVPLWINGDDWTPRAGQLGRVVAIALFAIGMGILLWCFRDFVVRGRGTPAPYDPPRKLVVEGLYRFTRNPMYVGIVTALFGESLWRWSSSLALYAIAVAVAFHLRVLLYEEPKLTELFGEEFLTYKRQVPRWLPTLGH